MERKLEDTKRQVQREILEKIEGLGHQLHRTSIADSGDYSTSPGIPLQNSTLMHAERSVHKMLKPPTYDGQSSWSMYRRQFEAAAKANGWTSQEMATSLVISLRGQALEILQSIPEERQNDYDRIVGALEIRYGHKYLRQVYQSQIKSRQQRTNESLQEYEADIERLVHLAYPQAPKEFLEQIGIQTFIDGLLDTEMQQALRLGRHTTICDALIAALEFKAAKEASRSYKSRELERRKQDTDEYAGQEWSLPFPKARISLQITTERFGKRQLVDARGRVENQDAQVREMSDQHLFVDNMMNESVISRNKNRSICVDVMDRLKEFYLDTGLNGIPFVFAMAYCIGSGRAPDGVSAVYQLVLPKARIHQVLEELHSSPSGGHFGVTRTLARVRDRFYWVNCRRDVEEWDWDKLVPLFLLSYRSSQHESTTYTPSMLTSGREMKLPTDLMLGRPLEETEERSLPEFVEDLRKRMDRIHRFAREKLKIHSDKMKQRLDTTSTETAFKPGDASNWEGPYTIIKKINDLVYRIQLSPRSKPKVVHLERLARYTGHNPPDWFVVEDPPPRTEDSVIRDE
ncbi:hypothetical protein NQ318_011080 [Aromia moschata]|uniref:Uncharacterized protein n=1 Tax=Aromia moschata TaxID=1265417 RepID=A0AAV8YR51_9CUCU|nr:hypothetical protein NQ318_011080 [Aromia moschata]